MQVKPELELEYAEYKAINNDPYGARIVSYSEDWANLMEAELDTGKQIEDVAKACAPKADYDGITGFMYGCAVSSLAHFWVHGEALRVWHNKSTQLGTEGDKANETGGVLNPALLSIG